MEKKSIYDYFFLGTAVRYLQDIGENSSIFKKSAVLENINICLSNFDHFDLKVTQVASRTLSSFRNKLLKITDKEAVLSPEQAKELRDICHELRPTLQSELVTHEAYVLTPKRFDINRLLEDIGSLMSPNVFSSLPDITQYDFSEAGRCIAFERPTAAAFHLLRGTEAVLRLFYTSLIHTKRVSPLLWGNITEDLRNRPRTKKHVTLYNNLDNIRHSYRNPTQHPDAIYDIHEAQDLLPLCFESVNRMMKTLKAI